MDLKREVPLQGIVFGDSYDKRMVPPILEKAKMLFDVAGTPMINYTFEFLRKNGVKEIFVIVSEYIEEFENYIEAYKLKHFTANIQIIKSKIVSNAGEALREVDSLGIINSDPFIICFGDTIANIDLKPALNEHKLRRKKDKNCILTSLFLKTSALQQKRPIDDELVVVFDKNSKRIIKYDNSISTKNVTLDFEDNEEICAEHSEVEIRSDLIDCEIDICSQEMLLEIAGNYDYQHLRRDYIQNEVMNRDLGYKIYLHELKSSDYAQRILDFRSLFYISSDILNRFTFPFVPDIEWSKINSTKDLKLKCEDGFQYISNKSSFERGVKLIGDCLVEENCKINRDTILENVIVGKNSLIGTNVSIKNSIIFDDVIIEDNCIISNSFVFNSCHIKKQSKLIDSCLSFGVVVDDNTEIKDFSLVHNNSKVLHRRRKLNSYSSEISLTSDKPSVIENKICGANGLGLKFNLPVEMDEDVDYCKGETYRKQDGIIPKWCLPGLKDTTKRYHLSKILLDDELDLLKRERFNSFSDIESVEDNEEVKYDLNKSFINGVKDILNLDEPNENFTLELSCFKYAEHKTSAECLAVVFGLVFQPIMLLSETELLTSFKSRLFSWIPFFKTYMTEEGCATILFELLEVVFLYEPNDVVKACIFVATKSYEELQTLKSSSKLVQSKFPFALGEVLTLFEEIEFESWYNVRKTKSIPMTLLNLELSQRVIEAQLEDSDEYETESD